MGNNKRKLNLEQLDKLEKKLLNDIDFIIAQNALVDNDILDILQDKDITKNYNEEFTNNIRNENAKISDQKQTGRCWIFATLNMIRDKFISDYNLESFEFSQSYLAFYDKLEKANTYLNHIIDNIEKDEDDRLMHYLFDDPVSDGGFFDMAKNLILKYGLVPKHEMPDTFAAKNTNIINRLIDIKLKMATIAIKENKIDANKIYELKEFYLQEIYKILVYCYGKTPVKFNLELKNKDKKDKIKKFYNLTPLTFLKKINFDFQDYTTIVYTPYKKIKPYQKYKLEYSANVYENGNLEFLTVDKNAFKFLCLSMLYKSKSLWFACDVDHFLSMKDGIWDNNLYDFSEFFKISFDTNISNHIEYRQVGSNHAMTLQGFDIDLKKWNNYKKNHFKNSKKIDILNIFDLMQYIPINKWNVENSWGEKVGNKGLFSINNGWFENYVYEIIISKSNLKQFLKLPSFLTRKEYSCFVTKNKESKQKFLYDFLIGKTLDKKAILLNAWNPFNKMMKGK